MEIALIKIKPKNTIGPERIPDFLLYDCASVLTASVTCLFFYHYETALFPKYSKIVFVFKKGYINSIEDFHPRTIVNDISTAYEIAIYQLIFNHSQHMVTDKQQGFIRSRSTSRNLLYLTQFIAEAINCSLVDVIYTDLPKVFDKLNQNILLMKMENIEFDADLCSL